ncbi:MAG: double-strand break repair helicase AddA, partial [Alphaproteobacteria bacterium]
ALAEVTGRIHELSFPDLIADLSYERGRIAACADHHGGIEGLIAATYALLGIDCDVTPDSVIADACADGAFDEAGLRRAIPPLAQATGKSDPRTAAMLTRWLEDSAGRVDYFADYLAVYLTQKAEPRKNLCGKKLRLAEPWLADVLVTEQHRMLAVLDRRNKATVGLATAALLRLAGAIIDIYARRKAERGMLDYDDLILLTRTLLERHGVAAWVLFKLDGGLDHILIDEAQDTNPDQWRIVAGLADEFFAGEGAGEPHRHRTIFAVGDVKQSIFSFQRADPAVFDTMRRRFRRQVLAADAAWDDVELDVSFRSVRPVLHAIDEVFAAPAARPGVVASEAVLSHLPVRLRDAGRVEVWPLLRAHDPIPPEAWKPPVERVSSDSPRSRLAALLARRIRAWLDTGEYLPARGRAMEPGDIVILVRSRGAFVEEMVYALKGQSVPVAGVDRMVLTDQLVVMDLVALGEFLLLPEDDLTLATVLKGPLIGLDEDALFELAHDRKGNLWQALCAHARADSAFGRAHETLAAYLSQVDFSPPYDFFAGLLAAGGRRRLLSRLGAEAEDPLYEFLSLALAYERTNAPTMQGFLHWLAAGDTQIKRDLEQGGGQVRVLTVHGAKGLQAPVVILPDTTRVPDRPPRLLWPAGQNVMLWAPYSDDRDSVATNAHSQARAAQDDEYRRLLYVAMSRAEDRLYVCGWHAGRAPATGCWYNLVADALRPIAQEIEDPFFATVADDLDSTVWRLDQQQAATVEPPAKDEAPAEDTASALPAWALTPAPIEPHPPRPLAPSRPAGEEPPVRPPLTADGGDPYRRGLLIHRLLQSLPDLPPPHRLAACQRLLAQPAHKLSEPEREAIADEVMAVLSHPAFGRLFGPGSRAEVPIAGVIGRRGSGAPGVGNAPGVGDGPGVGGAPGVVVSGQVDRLLVTDSEVLVLDYKTNRPPPTRPDDVPPIYLRQMATYRALLRQVYPDKSVRCALLWTDGPTLMLLSDAHLDPHDPVSIPGEQAPLP